ncbi:MAG: hypothetical protein J6F31_07660 [Oscillospiraceae bacterium]|nr:hypothetical protein [Oscillospiraceae bacterium]
MKGIRSFAALVLAVVLSLLTPGGSAFAGDYEAITASVPVKALLTKADGGKHVYEIGITPLEGAPAPIEDTILINEDSEGTLDISLDEPGTYIYKVEQIPGDDKRYKYDDTVYYVTVFVENVGDTLALRYGLSLTVNDMVTKPAVMEVMFQNTPSKEIIPVPPEPDPPDPQPPSPPSPPSPPVTTPVVPGTQPAVPGTQKPDGPEDDPSVGAGIYGDGLLLDVGTVVSRIAGDDTRSTEIAEKIENSFVGSIPVIYVVLVLLVIVLAALLKARSRKEDD